MRYAAVALVSLAALAAALIWAFSAYLVLVFGAGYYCEEYDSCGDATPLDWVQVGVAAAGLVALVVLVVRGAGALLSRRPWTAARVPAIVVGVLLAVWLGVAWEAL